MKSTHFFSEDQYVFSFYEARGDQGKEKVKIKVKKKV